ncbi:hypothetical protein NKH49_22405 [Mesorhizobium sp. M1088]|uniref:hypothetical protein n=1 Tax=Mesorhizobium sp. M1088 TaxID=2957056 RepID=UPI003339A8E4
MQELSIIRRFKYASDCHVERAAKEEEGMHRIATLATFSIGLAFFATISTSQSQAAPCGIVHKQARQPLSDQNFWLLAEHDGKAFVDQRTCLVARLDRLDQPATLSDAMGYCATLGQGGPHGDMGWELPTMAELTSLDSADWPSQREAFAQYKLPPLARSETEYWTRTEWPGLAGSFAVVAFSAPTTLVRPLEASKKAGVWCVFGAPATGLD